MKVIQTASAMREESQTRRCSDMRLALVPTMGALHEGHLTLVKEARLHADHVTATIFVNPTQFGPGEDFDRYPRPLEEDLECLQQAGIDCVFTPRASEIYPEGPRHVRSWVAVDGFDATLCGRHRPGHFRGVTTVVARLFNICQPDVALFGLKDAQQFVILRRMVRDLRFGIEVVGVPTVREYDGLAMSSRNRYLADGERRQAVVLYQGLQRAAGEVEKGEQRPEAIVGALLDTVGDAPDARVQYAEVVDVETLAPVERLKAGGDVLIATAVYFGSTRLIDNVFVRVPDAM
jgi:pantoate--beta-alanine ligase